MGIIDEELNNDNIKYQMDKTDFRIVSLLVLGYGSNKITSTLKILKDYSKKNNRILLSRMIKLEYIPNFLKLGIKKDYSYLP